MKKYYKRMSKAIVASILFVLLGNISINAKTDTPPIDTVGDFPCQYTTEDKIIALSTLWSELKYNFVNIDRLDFDLDSLYYKTIPEALNTKNDIEYFAVLKKFMNAMNDGHTDIYRESYDSSEYFDYVKYGFDYFEGKYFFIHYRDCETAVPELLGAEILTIEGMPVDEYIEKVGIPMTSGSTKAFRKQHAIISIQYESKYSYFCGTAKTMTGEIIEFKLLRDGETTRTEDDKGVFLSKSYSNFGQAPPTERKWRYFKLSWKDDIAVLYVDRFFGAGIEDEMDAAFAEIRANNPKGLIVDLRSNGGGDSSVALRLQMYLTDADSIRHFGVQRRINNAYYRSQGNYRPEYEDHYKGVAYEIYPYEYIQRPEEVVPVNCPVAILMDIYSYSACEDMLVNLYEVPNRPVYIGRETGGSTGAPLVIELPHGAYGRVCTQRILYPYSGKPFVGEGVKPDIHVERTLENYINGIDRDMETAVEYLNAVIN